MDLNAAGVFVVSKVAETHRHHSRSMARRSVLASQRGADSRGAAAYRRKLVTKKQDPKRRVHARRN